MPDTISMEVLQEKLNTLPLSTILSLLDEYQAKTGTDIEKYKCDAITEDWQKKLAALEINHSCPKCGSKNISKYGTNGKTKRFICKECKKTFSLFTNTIIEKTKYDWQAWKTVLYLLINRYSIQQIQEKMQEYGFRDIGYKTIFVWCHKILHAISQLPSPKLSGVIQVDETFFHESQKGSRNLQSFIKGEERLPSPKKKKAVYGINGNEFSNVVCLIDSVGHCVGKAVSLGYLTYDIFIKEFDSYIDRPTFICSDGNRLYSKYCQEKNIPHYVYPSSYKKTLQKAGYVSTHGLSPDEIEKTELKNKRILEALYDKKEIDFLEYYGSSISYNNFKKIKESNNLTINKVNRLHGYLKEHIEYGRRNVSTKFLNNYVAFEIFLRNWKVEHGTYPSTEADAESILITILQPNQICTKKDIFQRKMLLPTVGDKRMSNLKEKTLHARAVLDDEEFEFDEEDNVISFDKRKFLEKIPKCKLDELRRKYKIPKGYVKYSIISELVKKEFIDDDIVRLIAERKDKRKKEKERFVPEEESA